MKTCTKCGYTGDRFGKGRRVCHDCRKTQRDPQRYAEYQASAKRKEMKRINQNTYRSKNQAKVNAGVSACRAKRADRYIPLSSDEQFMVEEIYELAHIRTAATGVPHEVDHIVPLCGEQVSGLHVPHNLQVLTREDNRRKYNHYGRETV